jgi:hypothetical protein
VVTDKVVRADDGSYWWTVRNSLVCVSNFLTREPSRLKPMSRSSLLEVLANERCRKVQSILSSSGPKDGSEQSVACQSFMAELGAGTAPKNVYTPAESSTPETPPKKRGKTKAERLALLAIPSEMTLQLPVTPGGTDLFPIVVQCIYSPNAVTVKVDEASLAWMQAYVGEELKIDKYKRQRNGASHSGSVVSATLEVSWSYAKDAW